MFLLPRQPCFHCFEALPGFLEIPSGHLAALFLKTVEDVNHVLDTRQVNDALPSSFVLIAQFKHA